MSSVYKQLDPIENGTVWGPSAQATWDINLVGYELVAGSVNITMEIDYANFNGTYLTLDPIVGANAFFGDFVLQSDNLGFMKSDSNNARYLKHARYSNLDKSKIAFLGKEMCGTTGDFTFFKGLSAKVRPPIMLNGSNVNLSYEKFGNLRLSTCLQPISQIFATDNTNPAFTYTITSLKLNYAVVPSKGYVGPVEFTSYHSEIPTLVSKNQSFQNNIGNMAVTAVSCSFERMSSAQNQAVNPLIFENIGTTQVDFLFNDMINGLFSFSLKKPEEIILNGLSLNRNGYTEYYPDANDLNQFCPLIGLKFGNPLDLSVQKFTLNVQSTIPDNTQPNTFRAHLFFTGVKVF